VAAIPQLETKMTKALFLKQNLNPGEVYAGLILGKDGAPDYHLVLLPGQATDVTWSEAKEFASGAGGELPMRREQALLFANLPEEFERRWYWSGEQHASDPSLAWLQLFLGGGQFYNHKDGEGRARVVRRLVIQ
jgi:hypothetical protein